jgi:hypothetical protein
MANAAKAFAVVDQLLQDHLGPSMNHSSSQGPEALRGWMTVEELRARIFAGKEKARTDRAGQSLDEKFAILEQMREMAEVVRAGGIAQAQSAS